MSQFTEFLNFIQVLSAIILTITTMILNGIRRHLGEIQKELKLASDKLIELETWKNYHDRNCTDKHDGHHEAQRDLWREVNELKSKVHGYRGNT